MATRSIAIKSITTSLPDVECHMCRRRLLRGEQPDVFVVGGRPRLVCELCAPRAAHEGWQRESEAPRLSPASPRAQVGRTLLDRLRSLREVNRPASRRPARRGSAEGAEESSIDFLDATRSISRERSLSFLDESFAPEDPLASFDPSTEPEQVPVEGLVAHVDQEMATALQAFNHSEHPRRIAGVARSLGEATINVQKTAQEVSIVVAWELCWYRYGVTLEDGGVVRLADQGTELSQLSSEDRLQNAKANGHGELILLG
jgi:hypothetical protein